MEPNPQHGEQFLHSRDSKLQSSLAVELEQIHREQAGETPETKPVERIADWMDVLKQTHESHGDDPRVLERIKTSYHKEYVIHPEDVPESTFLLEARIAREQGHGDIEITPQYREAKTAEIVANQEQSLDKWVNYLTSEDATYPMWAKYWAFTSVTKMGKFEKTIDKDEHEHARFAKRSPDTTAPFPPLNPRALALVVDAIDAKAKQRSLPKATRSEIENTSTTLSDQEFKQLLSGESFSELYTQFLVELPEYSAEGLRETRGDWVKYEQGSDPQPLVDSLEGHPLEWCTAGYETARTQLQAGDFYVYYSLDDKGLAKIPRVAIRMKQERIAEVRGIRPHQELDPFIGDVVQAKMDEFPDGDEYRQRVEDMKRVTRLREAAAKDEKFSDEDVRFIYEFDRYIEGFGNQRDPRIDELVHSDIGMDSLAGMFDCERDDISFDQRTTVERFTTRPVKVHIGDLNLNSLSTAEGVTLPTVMNGNLELRRLTSTKGLALPTIMKGSLSLTGLTTAEGLILPTEMSGVLDLSSLTSAEGLTLPTVMNAGLDLRSLTSAAGLILPKNLNGYLLLGSLSSAEGLTLPDKIDSTLSLNSLTTAEGLVLPEICNGDLRLAGLTSAKGLSLPKKVGGALNLAGITSAEGLVLPETINKRLILSGLTTAKGLILPENMKGGLDLSGLTSADGLALPEIVGDILNLSGLTSAERLILPDGLMDRLYLSSLTSLEGLTLPSRVTSVFLNKLVENDTLILPGNFDGRIVYEN